MVTVSEVENKIKNINTKYHGTLFIPFKSQVYSQQGSPIFLLFGSWSLVLHFHVWVKSNLILIIQTDVQRLHEDGK